MIYFFKHGAIREEFKSPGILLAAKKLDYPMMTEEERRGYDDYLAYLGQELGILGERCLSDTIMKLNYKSVA